jgi:hypothetical protein
MAAVSFGIGGQGLPMKLLNPLTGAVEKELEVKSAISSVYSRDGSKLLVNTMPTFPCILSTVVAESIQRFCCSAGINLN